MQLAKQIAKQVLSTVKSSVAEPLTLQAYKVIPFTTLIPQAIVDLLLYFEDPVLPLLRKKQEGSLFFESGSLLDEIGLAHADFEQDYAKACLQHQQSGGPAYAEQKLIEFDFSPGKTKPKEPEVVVKICVPLKYREGRGLVEIRKSSFSLTWPSR